jgi:hypothetical protein
VDLYSAIEDLRQGLEKLDQLIAGLEEFERTGNMPLPRTRGRKSMGEEERKAVSERMKKFWADRRLRMAAGQG